MQQELLFRELGARFEVHLSFYMAMRDGSRDRTVESRSQGANTEGAPENEIDLPI